MTTTTIAPSSKSASPKSSDNRKSKKKKKEANVNNSNTIITQRPKARLAAIGPTTAAHLRDVLKLEVAAVASKPTPEAFAKAVGDVEVPGAVVP